MEQRALPDFRATRAKAGEILSQKSNRLKLTEAIIVCLLPVLLSVLLVQLFESVADLTLSGDAARTAAAIGFNCLLGLFHLFFTLPLLMGLFGMAAGMARGDSVSLTELFAPYANGAAYRQVLSLSLRLVLRVAALIFAVEGTLLLFRLFGRGILALAILTAVLAVGEVIVWIALLLLRFRVLFFVCGERMPVREANRRAARVAKRSRRGGAVWLLSFLPWILLGLLTVGILLLADVIPRMCISYFLYTEQMTETLNPSEE